MSVRCCWCRSSKLSAMAQWQVLLITGPAGAGKTTAARAFATAQSNPAVHLSLDAFRGAIVSGSANSLEGWDEECGRQYRLARAACAATARTFAKAGYLVVIDDAVFPGWPEADLTGWQGDLDGLKLALAVLMPSLEAAIERDALRSEHTVGPGMVRVIYRMMRGWRDEHVRVIDNSQLTPEETAAALQHLLDESCARIGEANFV